MFSLIVTIISIVLVAILAIATIWYGGSVYTSNQDSIRASTLTNQASQLYAGALLYAQDHNGTWPTSPNQLLEDNGKYLTAIPIPPAQALTTAKAGTWGTASTAYAQTAETFSMQVWKYNEYIPGLRGNLQAFAPNPIQHEAVTPSMSAVLDTDVMYLIAKPTTARLAELASGSGMHEVMPGYTATLNGNLLSNTWLWNRVDCNDGTSDFCFAGYLDLAVTPYAYFNVGGSNTLVFSGTDQGSGATLTINLTFSVALGPQSTSCATGQHWDAGSGFCVSDTGLPNCPPSNHWDTGQGLCVADSVTPPTCQANSTWNGTACVCNSGYTDNGSGSCIVSTPTCPANATWDGSACSCNSGFANDGNGQCVASTPACQTNATWNGTACFCDSGYTDNGSGQCAASTPSCQANATWNGTSCTCNSGYADDGGGSCITTTPICQTNANWNGSSCACNSGFADNGSGQCVSTAPACPVNQHWDSGSGTCVADAVPVNVSEWEFIMNSNGQIAYIVLKNSVNAGTCKQVIRKARNSGSSWSAPFDNTVIGKDISPDLVYQCIDAVPTTLENRAPTLGYTFYWLAPGNGNACDSVNVMNSALNLTGSNSLQCNAGATCPTGFHFETGSNSCVVDPITCPSDQHYDVGSDSCVSNTPSCGVGTHLDIPSNMCVPNTSCPTGQHWDATQDLCVNDVATCPTGQHMDGSTCVNDAPICPVGQHLNGTQDACLCNLDNLPPSGGVCATYAPETVVYVNPWVQDWPTWSLGVSELSYPLMANSTIRTEASLDPSIQTLCLGLNVTEANSACNSGSMSWTRLGPGTFTAVDTVPYFAGSEGQLSTSLKLYGKTNTGIISEVPARIQMVPLFRGAVSGAPYTYPYTGGLPLSGAYETPPVIATVLAQAQGSRGVTHYYLPDALYGPDAVYGALDSGAALAGTPFTGAITLPVTTSLRYSSYTGSVYAIYSDEASPSRTTGAGIPITQSIRWPSPLVTLSTADGASVWSGSAWSGVCPAEGSNLKMTFGSNPFVYSVLIGATEVPRNAPNVGNAITFTAPAIAGDFNVTLKGGGLAHGHPINMGQSETAAGITAPEYLFSDSSYSSGSYTRDAGTIHLCPLVCTFNGQTVPVGQSITAWANSSGSPCVSQLRTCNNLGGGNAALTGSYPYDSCVDTTGNSCTLDGQTIADGQTVPAFASATAPTCTSQNRTCNAGVLSGTGEFLACTETGGGGGGGGATYNFFGDLTNDLGFGGTLHEINSLKDWFFTHTNWSCNAGGLEDTAWCNSLRLVNQSDALGFNSYESYTPVSSGLSGGQVGIFTGTGTWGGISASGGNWTVNGVPNAGTLNCTLTNISSWNAVNVVPDIRDRRYVLATCTGN